jgi:hypothetical protein
MQYTVVHSKDPYLLARLATDLQMSGADVQKNWDLHPFIPQNRFQYLRLSESNVITFHSHPCFLSRSFGAEFHELTSRNYIKVLTQILEP